MRLSTVRVEASSSPLTQSGGNHWVLQNQGIVSGANIGVTIRLAQSPIDANTIYATVFDLSLGQGWLTKGVPGGAPIRFVTTNGGQTWTSMNQLPGELSANPAVNAFASNPTAEFRFWHVLLATDPTNSKVVYANEAYTLFRSPDGGQTWTQDAPFKDDFDGMSFDAGGGLALFGDRSIYRSTDEGSTWIARPGSLQTTEFYDLTPSQTGANVAFGVAQDHGFYLSYTGQSVWGYAGDGMETGKALLDPQNPLRLYGYDPLEHPDVNNNPIPGNILLRSDDGGVSWMPIGGTINNNWSPTISNYAFA
jgi:photosystem II stability/assembly factor-like uncharacterized protein